MMGSKNRGPQECRAPGKPRLRGSFRYGSQAVVMRDTALYRKATLPPTPRLHQACPSFAGVRIRDTSTRQAVSGSLRLNLEKTPAHCKSFSRGSPHALAKSHILHLAQQQWLLGNSTWAHSYLPALGFPDTLVALLGEGMLEVAGDIPRNSSFFFFKGGCCFCSE